MFLRALASVTVVIHSPPWHLDHKQHQYDNVLILEPGSRALDDDICVVRSNDGRRLQPCPPWCWCRYKQTVLTERTVKSAVGQSYIHMSTLRWLFLINILYYIVLYKSQTEFLKLQSKSITSEQHLVTTIFFSDCFDQFFSVNWHLFKRKQKTVHW